MKTHGWLLLAARIGIFAAALGIIVASNQFFNPRNFPFHGMSPQATQTLAYGGFALALAAFTYLWPGAGGIITALYGAYNILLFWLLIDTPLTLIPAPLFTVLYGIFTIGGILNITHELRTKKAPYTGSKRLRGAAMTISLAAIALFFIIYLIVYPSIISFTIPALFLVGLAWFWPAPGGLLMIVMSIFGIYQLYGAGWGIPWKWLACALLVVYAASGGLHLVTAWRCRKMPEATEG